MHNVMIGRNIIKLEKTESTNLYLNQLLKDKSIDEGTVVIADEQSEGRGQVNNKWESNMGENILMSFAIFPDFLEASSQFMLSKFVSLALIEFLNCYIENVKIKWPNDIYIKDKKIAGILIENSLRGSIISNSIIGIGININQREFSVLIPNPTSMKIETGRNYILAELLQEILNSLNKIYNKLIKNEFAWINEQYLKALYLHNEIHQFKDGSEVFSAKITGIDDIGRIKLLDSDNRQRIYSFKEVEFL